MQLLATPPSQFVTSCVASSGLHPLKSRTAHPDVAPLPRALSASAPINQILSAVSDDRLLCFHCVDVDNAATPIQLQLTAAGVADVVRHRSWGLSTHLRCDEFVERFGVFMPWHVYVDVRAMDQRAQCRVCEEVFLHPDVCAVLASITQPYAVDTVRGTVRLYIN
jgi:hypothetical protein